MCPDTTDKIVYPTLPDPLMGRDSHKEVPNFPAGSFLTHPCWSPLRGAPAAKDPGFHAQQHRPFCALASGSGRPGAGVSPPPGGPAPFPSGSRPRRARAPPLVPPGWLHGSRSPPAPASCRQPGPRGSGACTEAAGSGAAMDRKVAREFRHKVGAARGPLNSEVPNEVLPLAR